MELTEFGHKKMYRQSLVYVQVELMIHLKITN